MQDILKNVRLVWLLKQLQKSKENACVWSSDPWNDLTKLRMYCLRKSIIQQIKIICLT